MPWLLSPLVHRSSKICSRRVAPGDARVEFVLLGGRCRGNDSGREAPWKALHSALFALSRNSRRHLHLRQCRRSIQWTLWNWTFTPMPSMPRCTHASQTPALDAPSLRFVSRNDGGSACVIQVPPSLLQEMHRRALHIH